MYKIYTTEAFILNSRPVAEASAQISLFTKELGLVRAHAQGVRLIRSKLRAGLQTLEEGLVSLVRGREVWRLTSTLGEAQHVSAFSLGERRLWAQLLSLVERLVPGEESDVPLYHLLGQLFIFLQREELSATELQQLELFSTLQVLHHLGYVGSEQTEQFLLSPLTRATLLKVAGYEKALRQVIERSLSASQL